ncbi:MAG: RNA methyltransferase [Crocinitomicaceae bacterium]|nr:RNA methyltransferase [Crocinitomicaceae bacterium]
MENISIQKIKWIKSLQLKKNRENENVFVVEGKKIVLELIANFPDLIQLIVGKSDLVQQLDNVNQTTMYFAKAVELERMTALNSAPTVLAVVKKFEMKTLNFSKRILILDDIQDPGNLGTIIRTADWFGIDQIVCSENTVDLYNIKTLQATMGSFMRVNVHYKNLPNFISEIKQPIYGSLMKGTNINEIDSNSIKVLILGNEGKGISQEVINLITNPITINGFGGAESLNVGVAAGILMHHWSK